MPSTDCLYEWFRSHNHLCTISGHNTPFLLGNGKIMTSSPPQAQILLDWDVGSGLLCPVIWEPLSTLLVPTCPVIHPLPKIIASKPNINPTSLARVIPLPRTAFLHNLGVAISTWQVAGDQIILMANMNGDIPKANITNFCNNLGLCKSILLVQPTLFPPVAFKQGNWVGKSPIDGVWMSATLLAAAIFFCPFSLSPGDHNAAILDIDLALLIGKLCLSIVQPKACCLNTQVPQTKEHYLFLLENYFLSHHLPPALPILPGCGSPLL